MKGSTCVLCLLSSNTVCSFVYSEVLKICKTVEHVSRYHGLSPLHVLEPFAYEQK